MISLIMLLTVGQINILKDGVPVDRATKQLDLRGSSVSCVPASSSVRCTFGLTGDAGTGGAPVDATYITQTSNATLTNEQALSSLSTGLMSVTTGTGVVSNYAGATCSAGQYASAVSAAGALTCGQVAYSQVSGTPTIPTDISGAGYWTKTSEASLSNEVAMGSLNGGLIINTALTGIPTIFAGSTCSAGLYATSLGALGGLSCAQVSYGQLSGTPTIPADISGASYWTRVSEAGLSNETAMGSLGTGLVLNATTTGVPTIYAGATCSAGQYTTATSASGALTCAQVAFSQLSGTASLAQGGTTETSATEDAVLVGLNTDGGVGDWEKKTLPSCSNATTSKLLYDNSTNTFSCGVDQDTGGTSLATWSARTTEVHTIGSTTATEVTALQIRIDGAGTYDVRYVLRTRSSSTTNGYKYGVNVTTNLSSLNCVAVHATSGTTAANGLGDGTAAVLTGSLYEVLGATNAASTTAANMGPNTGVTGTTDTVRVIITCSVVTSGAGDLELWMGSEAAVNVTNEPNSYVIVQKIP